MMPVIATSQYRPPALLKNSHLQAIFPHLFRRFKDPEYQRERISTPDNDFLDLDWSLSQGNQKLVIISHGLEGHSKRGYVLGMVKALNLAGFNALAYNYRGCSEDMNLKRHLYHSGSSNDLEVVIEHAIKKGFDNIVLVGFSLGGNITLKYLGEKSDALPAQVKKAAVFSVPVDLHSSAMHLSKKENSFYLKRFLASLYSKIEKKAEKYKDIDLVPLKSIKSFKDFDDLYTAPLNGFIDAKDYWSKCSSKPLIKSITIPTLIVNAKDDTFLPPECYPVSEAAENSNVVLEMPENGGHTGFVKFNRCGLYWSEMRAIKFFIKPGC